jgi:peptide/nickel transport system substrate-binding protein
VNPAPHCALDSSGATAWFGWPKSDSVQDKIAAPDLAAEQPIAALNEAAMTS